MPLLEVILYCTIDNENEEAFKNVYNVNSTNKIEKY
jgi:hypothetical protein